MGILRSTTRRASGLLIGLAVALTALVAVLALGTALFNPFRTETVDRSGPTVVERIRELEEFTAAQAEFVQDVDIESDAKYVPDAIKGERVVAIAEGSVRATVDLGGLDAGAVTVSEDGTSILLTLPPPVLQDAEVEESTTRIVARQRGVLDRIGDLVSANPYDDGDLYAAAEAKLNAAAGDSDLETTARANTEAWLETFLGAVGFDQVTVSWAESPA
jgi:hypothetical protein